MEGKDIIIIGAGIGGISVGAFLSKRGYRITIFEKNFNYGGYCQAFKRKGFLINPAVLRVGTKECADRIDGYCEQLHIKKPEWTPYSDTYILGDGLRIDLGAATLEQELIKKFSEDERSIRTFFENTEKIFKISDKIIKNNMNFDGLSIEEIKQYILYLKMETQELIELYFSKNVILQNVLLALMDLDSKSAAISMLINIYAVKNNGKAHIMHGGMWLFINQLVEAIERNEGKVICNTKVDKILVEDNAAKGVMVNGEKIFADAVISAIDIRQTYFELIDSRIIKKQEVLRKILYDWKPSHSCFSIWIGLDCTLEELGIEEESLVIYPSPEKIRDVREIMKTENEKLPKDFWFQLFTVFSKDKECTPDGKAQMSIGLIVPYSMEEFWGKEKGVEKATKYKIRDMVLKRVEAVYPQIKGHYVTLDSATPLTHERYTNNYRGSYYGFEKYRNFVCDKSRHKNAGLLENLYLCSQWTSSTGGCMGVMQDAIRTANLIMKEQPIKNRVLEEYDLLV